MSSDTEKIKERLDIVDVIGSYLKLEKAGSNFKAKCPFHNEKTPSFFVSPARGSYRCFGCGAGGDIFTFVEEFEGLDFRGALEILAARAGITLRREDPAKRDERARLLDITEEAAKFFESSLRSNSKVKEYISKRGIKPKTAEVWRLGYAPEGSGEIINHLSKKNFTKKEMEQAGIIKVEDSKTYSRFRDRIIFPIADTSGRVIGFSGRIFSENTKAPKYLNSPDTALFDKSDVLYGLDKAKEQIRKKGYSILVEGQIDLVLSHQAGFENTIALSGTALSDKQIERLWRLGKTIVIAFDSDRAGMAAASKNGERALAAGMEVKVAFLPKGSDPADAITSDVAIWKKAISESKHLIEFYLEVLLSLGLEKRRLGREIVRKVLPAISRLGSSVEQGHFISLVAARTGISEKALREDLLKVKDEPSSESDSTLEVTFQNKKPKEDLVRKQLVALSKARGIKQKYRKKIIDEVKKIAGQSALDSVELSDREQEKIAFETEANFQEEGALEKHVESLLARFERDHLKAEYSKYAAELTGAEKKGQKTETRHLLAKCREISKKIETLNARL